MPADMSGRKRRRSSNETKEVISGNNSKKKILVVEDTVEIANSLSSLLEKYGTVDMAYNGQEALKKVSINGYDAIVSDIDMPEMNGIELYKAAVEIDSNLRRRFMFLTSSFATAHLNFFIENDLPFLFKPAEIVDIENGVEEILCRTYNCGDGGTGINNSGMGTS